MTGHKFWILGYTLDGAGGAAVLGAQDPYPTGKDHWIHLHAGKPETRKYLKDMLHLDPFVIKALLAAETRPRFDEFGEGLLIILRGINHNEEDKPEDMVSIRLWVDERRVISLAAKNLRSTGEIVERFAQNRGPHNTGEFISILLTHLIDAMSPKIAQLEAEIDKIEDQVLDAGSSDLRKDIMDIRKRSLTYRRYIAPQRDVVHHVKRVGKSWMTRQDLRYLQDNEDRLSRYIEDLDAIREHTEIIQEELLGTLTVKLNRNMYTLSVIAAIFMPLSFITGLFGSNIGGIPGSGDPRAFITFCLSLLCVMIFQALIFKRMKWL